MPVSRIISALLSEKLVVVSCVKYSNVKSINSGWFSVRVRLAAYRNILYEVY